MTAGSTRVARSAGIQHARDRDRQEYYCHPDEGDGICRRHSVEQTFHQARERQRKRESDRKSDEREPQSIPQHETHNVTRLRAERDANAEILRLARDVVRKHAVDSDGSQSNAPAANTPRRKVLKRRGPSDFEMTSFIKMTSPTGWSESRR